MSEENEEVQEPSEENPITDVEPIEPEWMPKKGRSLLTKGVHRIIVTGVKEYGMRLPVAAASAGMKWPTVRNWIRRGLLPEGHEDFSEKYKAFAEDLAEAHHAFEAKMLERLHAQGEAEDAPWQLNFKLLQAHTPEKYGNRSMAGGNVTPTDVYGEEFRDDTAEGELELPTPDALERVVGSALLANKEARAALSPEDDISDIAEKD